MTDKLCCNRSAQRRCIRSGGFNACVTRRARAAATGSESQEYRICGHLKTRPDMNQDFPQPENMPSDKSYESGPTIVSGHRT
jgi:hypothetical protein